eukprot:10170580-Karenia_brevis.AAC.1
MVAIVQQLPNRKRPRADGLEVIKPTAQQMLEAKGHHLEEWMKGKVLEGATCPAPKIWGHPQESKPWLVPTGHNLQWGSFTLNNTGAGGHMFQ